MSFERDNKKNIKQMLECAENERKGLGFPYIIVSYRDWDSIIHDRDIFTLAERKIIKGILSSSSTKRILDIGCGQGKAVEELKIKYPHIECHGIDIAFRDNFSQTEKEIYLNIMDAHNLEFPDNYFDMVFSAFSFMYFTDKLKCIKEAHRVLIPNGRGYLHLGHEWFDPPGKAIIPRSSENSDVFWDGRYRKVMIDKRGEGTSCLDIEYKSFSHDEMSCYSYTSTS